MQIKKHLKVDDKLLWLDIFFTDAYLIGFDEDI